MSIIFEQDDNLRVHATAEDGGSISSQTVEALLLFAILDKLEQIRCGNIDIETAIKEI